MLLLIFFTSPARRDHHQIGGAVKLPKDPTMLNLSIEEKIARTGDIHTFGLKFCSCGQGKCTLGLGVN